MFGSMVNVSTKSLASVFCSIVFHFYIHVHYSIIKTKPCKIMIVLFSNDADDGTKETGITKCTVNFLEDYPSHTPNLTKHVSIR